MSLLFRKLGHNSAKNILYRHNESQVFVVSHRKLSIIPTFYDGEQDPALKFFSSNVHALLKRLTRPDYSKVFRKRTNRGLPVLKTPFYKFLTQEELEGEMNNANRKANKLLQMPPAVQIHKPINDVLSKDPALVGYDTATYLFTDITFGLDNQHRIIVQRDPDGTLQSSDHDIRKRLNQVYFPIKGRKIKEPMMFTQDEKLNNLLDREEYEFVLDRACLQYEPDEMQYQRVTSIAYQHVDAMNKYDILRSTRHFGPLVFYLTWHQNIDNLMLELIQNGVVREAVLLTALLHAIHGDQVIGDFAQTLTNEILSTPVQLTKSERLTEADIQLDNKCVQCVEMYISSTSSMKSQQELALQGFREYYQQMMELSRGLRKAHGNV